MIKKLTIIVILAFSASCTLGVSTQLGTYYSTAVFQCVLNSGYKDAAVVAFSSSTGVKPYAIQDIMNIKNSGIDISIWLNPCRAREPLQQIQDFIKKVPKTLYDRIWIAPDNNPDLNCAWYNQKHPIDPAKNCQYLLNILQVVKQNGLKTGVITNKFVWGLIFKDTCLEAGAQALYWLPQAPNGVPNFDDFNPFGGWKQPSVKAYRTSAIVCGAYLNLHYYP